MREANKFLIGGVVGFFGMYGFSFLLTWVMSMSMHMVGDLDDSPPPCHVRLCENEGPQN